MDLCSGIWRRCRCLPGHTLEQSNWPGRQHETDKWESPPGSPDGWGREWTTLDSAKHIDNGTKAIRNLPLLKWTFLIHFIHVIQGQMYLLKPKILLWIEDMLYIIIKGCLETRFRWNVWLVLGKLIDVGAFLFLCRWYIILGDNIAFPNTNAYVYYEDILNVCLCF